MYKRKKIGKWLPMAHLIVLQPRSLAIRSVFSLLSSPVSLPVLGLSPLSFPLPSFQNQLPASSSCPSLQQLTPQHVSPGPALLPDLVLHAERWTNRPKIIATSCFCWNTLKSKEEENRKRDSVCSPIILSHYILHGPIWLWKFILILHCSNDKLQCL